MLKSSGASSTAASKWRRAASSGPAGAATRPAGVPRVPGAVRRRARRSAPLVGYDAVAHPLPQRLVVPLGLDLGEVLELVVARRDRRRLRDATLLVEPHRRGHVDDAEDVGEPVVRIEHGRQVGLAGPVADPLLVVVERDGDQVQAQRLELVGQCVPGRQLVAAAAPGRPRDDDGAPAAAGQVDVVPSASVSLSSGARSPRRTVVPPGSPRTATRVVPSTSSASGRPSASASSARREGLAQGRGTADVAAAEPVVLDLPARSPRARWAGRGQVVARLDVDRVDESPRWRRSRIVQE